MELNMGIGPGRHIDKFKLDLQLEGQALTNLHKIKCPWCYKDPLKGLDLDTTFRLRPGDLS